MYNIYYVLYGSEPEWTHFCEEDTMEEAEDTMKQLSAAICTASGKPAHALRIHDGALDTLAIND